VRTDGALVHGNSTLGLEIDGAQAGLRIVNTAVVSNGTADAMAPGGISIVDTDGWQIVYSTVAGNRGAADGVGTELTCNAGSTGDARNSIFMGESTGNDVSCPNGLFANSAIDQGTAGGMAAGENITDLPYQPTRFEDLPAGNFHVRNPESSELVDLALWQGSEGDPLTDFDGDVRPLVEGALDWVGADRP
jgi:hypothetical protein